MRNVNTATIAKDLLFEMPPKVWQIASSAYLKKDFTVLSHVVLHVALYAAAFSPMVLHAAVAAAAFSPVVLHVVVVVAAEVLDLVDAVEESFVFRRRVHISRATKP